MPRPVTAVFVTLSNTVHSTVLSQNSDTTSVYSIPVLRWWNCMLWDCPYISPGRFKDDLKKTSINLNQRMTFSFFYTHIL